MDNLNDTNEPTWPGGYAQTSLPTQQEDAVFSRAHGGLSGLDNLPATEKPEHMEKDKEHIKYILQ